MSFPRKAVDELLVACHRRCCICHRFCGFKMELDHMEQRAHGGLDDINNAIPVCFECHAEIHLYNDQHPRGRKYRSEELRLHKEQWLELCRSSAAVLAALPLQTDVGPLQALIDELEFNTTVANQSISSSAGDGKFGAPFEVAQFNRCISEGAVSLLETEVKDLLFRAYVAMKRANGLLHSAYSLAPGTAGGRPVVTNDAKEAFKEATGHIHPALEKIRQYISHELEESKE